MLITYENNFIFIAFKFFYKGDLTILFLVCKIVFSFGRHVALILMPRDR